MKRVVASSAEVRRKLDRFRALRNDPAAARDFALEILPAEGNPELLTAALRALGPNVRTEDHEVLRDLYDYFNQDGKRRDPGGSVRVEALNVLWHLRHAGDNELAVAAASTVEVTLNGSGAMIRAAGLALLGVLDREAAALKAAEMLGTGDADRMTAEPAITAARLLATQGETAALLLYVHAFRRNGPNDVVAECLRGLAGVPTEHLASLLHSVATSEDDVLLLGLCDLIVDHEPHALLTETARRIFAAPDQDEIFGYLAAAAIARRRDDLIAALLAALKRETSPTRRKIAAHALELAAPSAAVDEARALLADRGPTG